MNDICSKILYFKNISNETFHLIIQFNLDFSINIEFIFLSVLKVIVAIIVTTDLALITVTISYN